VPLEGDSPTLSCESLTKRKKTQDYKRKGQTKDPKP
jgi:hypothetical protein